MSTANNKALINRFLKEVINESKYEVCDEIVALDFVELDPLPGQEQGREGLKWVLRMLRNAFPDMHWKVEEQIAEADTVVTRFVWTGTQKGPFLGIPASGREVTVPGVVIDQVEEGRMQKSRILMDTLGLLQQLGAIPGPP